jgi:hypothetical protein
MSTRLRVFCYAGYRGDEEPRELELDGRQVRVATVSERWSSPGRRGFRVQGDDGHVYTLSRDEASGGWVLERLAGAGSGMP